MNTASGPSAQPYSRPLWMPLPSAILTGFLLALFVLVGQSFSEAGDFSRLIGDAQLVAAAAARLVVFGMALGELLSLLFRWLDARRTRPARPSRVRAPRPLARVAAFLDAHVFACSLVLFGVSWGAYLIIFAPGTLAYDGARSLNQFCTDAPLENHHPVLMNLLYGALMQVGRAFGSDNLGVFLIVVLQASALAVAISLVLARSRRMGLPFAVTVVAALYFAWFPIWGALAQVAFKDTLFCALFAWFVLLLADSVREGPSPSVKAWVPLVVAGLLVALTRNNGIYLVAPSLLVLAVLQGVRGRRARRACAAQCAKGKGESAAPKHTWATALGACVSVVAVYALFTIVIYPACGVEMREEKEMLSIPLQQTARTLIEHPDDVSDEERLAIDTVLPTDELPSLYDPDLADPVKESYKLHNSKLEGSFEYSEAHPDALAAYLEAWAQMGLRHPLTYLEATVANTYAYFYPGEVVGVYGAPSSVFFFGQVGEPINTTYDVYYLMPQELVEAVEEGLQASVWLPVLRYLYTPGLYVWLLFVAIAYLAHARRWDALVVCLPPLLLLLTVLAGPVNGHMRYVMPLIAVLPLVWAEPLKPQKPKERPCGCPCGCTFMPKRSVPVVRRQPPYAVLRPFLSRSLTSSTDEPRNRAMSS